MKAPAGYEDFEIELFDEKESGRVSSGASACTGSGEWQWHVGTTGAPGYIDDLQLAAEGPVATTYDVEVATVSCHGASFRAPSRRTEPISQHPAVAGARHFQRLTAMQIWRLARSVYDPLDGEGARLYGGRWNQEGTALVPTSAHLALCVLEQLVHLNPEDVPNDLTAFRVDVPDDLLVEGVGTEDLPENWNRTADHPECRRIGKLWVQRESSAVLEVPSAVLPEEMNDLIHPHHPEAEAVHMVESRPLRLDHRLIRHREG